MKTIKNKIKNMSLLRIILAVLLPPLAVLDKGLGILLLTTILTLIGWFPGIVSALYFITNK